MNQRMIRYSMLAVTVAVLLGLWGGLMSQYMAYDQVSGALETEKAKLIKMQTEISQIEASIGAFQTEKEEFAELLFRERDVPAFLDQIAGHAKQAEISIVDMKTKQFNPVKIHRDVTEAAAHDRKVDRQVQSQKQEDATKLQASLSAMPIKMRVRGTYSSFVRFLEFLQEYRQLVNITDVEIKAQEYPLLDCEFEIRIYTLKDLPGTNV